MCVAPSVYVFVLVALRHTALSISWLSYRSFEQVRGMKLFRLVIGFCAELSGANMAQTEVLAVIAVGARWKLRTMFGQSAHGGSTKAFGL